MKQYKIILLDVDGTLLDFDKAEEQGIGFLLRTYGVPETEENKEAYHKLNQSYWRRMERGELTRDQARNHPHKNLITRALGAEPVLMADCFRQSMEPGEYLLLCSDGLSNIVTEQEMLYEVIHGGEDETCCQRLLDIALHRGAPDNVTAVLIRR